MKTRIKYFVVAISLFVSGACSEVEEPNITSDVSEITITASMEDFAPESRTIRQPDGYVWWSPSDEISIFLDDSDTGGSKFTSTNTSPASVTEFRGSVNRYTNGTMLYGVYPYSDKTKFSNGVTTISLPSEQTAAEGTFAKGVFPTIARSSGLALAFYNICGGVKFSVSRNDITSVTFKGNNSERLAGSAKVRFDDSGRPEVLSDDVDSKNEITINAPGGGLFKAGKEYYIVAFPTELKSGFTMTFRTSDGKEGKYVGNDAVTIKRSIFGVLNHIDKSVTSWAEIEGGQDPGVYLGIIGFNNKLYPYPITLLNDVSKPKLDSFIDGLSMASLTMLYYSVDEAINKLKAAHLPADLSTVAIVTFTDGLDQGSLMMNSSYSSSSEYLNALNYRISNEKVNNVPIAAYSIGLRGQDVHNLSEFQNMLKLLSSEWRDNGKYAYMVSSDINSAFADIAEQVSKQLSHNSYINTIKLKMPGLPNGTKIRFTLDNVSSADQSKHYIEGTFNPSSRSLENIRYVGLTANSGTTLKGDADGIFVTFTFEGVQTDGYEISPNNVNMWSYAEDYSTWRRQSEFERPTINTEIVTGRGSAAIMLVLDCSSSLGYDFVKLKSAGKEFINTVFNASNGTTPPGNTSESKSVETFTVNGVSFDMVRVDGGTYQMGSNNGYDEERPVHSETVSTFYIGKTEVTQALWQAVMGSNPSGYSSNNRPVENVSWDDCQQFITKLNQLTGRNFRLPGEAEWEYAARGGNKSRGYTYSGSNDIGSVAWYDGNSGDQTHPVAQKQANELGLYDMTGNVWEWTADKWCDNYSSPRNSSDRVYRGGGWDGSAVGCRVALRSSNSPGNRFNNLGLRLAL